MATPHSLDWQRVSGAFAHAAPASGPCDPTIGTAAHVCSCCGERYILIAAVAEDGAEVNVALPLAQAVDVAENITNSIKRLLGIPSAAALN